MTAGSLQAITEHEFLCHMTLGTRGQCSRFSPTKCLRAWCTHGAPPSLHISSEIPPECLLWNSCRRLQVVISCACRCVLKLSDFYCYLILRLNTALRIGPIALHSFSTGCHPFNTPSQVACSILPNPHPRRSVSPWQVDKVVQGAFQSNESQPVIPSA